MSCVGNESWSSSIFMGAVGADDRDPFEKDPGVVFLTVEPKRRRGVAVGLLDLEPQFLELGRLEPDHRRGRLLTVDLAVRETGPVIPEPSPPALYELPLQVAVASQA